MADSKFTALERMATYLEEKKFDAETIAFIMGRMMRLVTESVSQTVAGVIGEEATQKIAALEDTEEQAKELARLYQEKTGKTLDDLREELTEKLVKDFEAA